MKWIICFCESKNIGLWKLFTKYRHGFSHVYAVRYDPELDLWIRFECASQRFNFELLSEEAADYLVYDMVENCLCVEVEAVDNSIYAPRWLYCVSFVKHIIGIRKPWVLTPYQLYCELRRLNGKVIFEANDLLEQSNG